MSSYNDVVSKDIELLQLINHKIDQSNWLSDFFAKVVSKNPLKDVVLVLWFFFVFGLFEVGSKHFWVVIMNLIVVVRKCKEKFCLYESLTLFLAVRMMIEAKRPYEYDINLKPKTDLSSDSYA